MTPILIQFDKYTALEFGPVNNAPQAPLIVLLHGFGCDKETHLTEAADLAGRGFRVVLPDAHLHGAGAHPQLEAAGPFEKVKQLDQIYWQTAQSVGPIIDWVHQHQGVQVPVALIGISMGGCAALCHLTYMRHPALAAASVWLASPFIENHIRAMVNLLPEFGAHVNELLLARVRQIEPAHKLEALQNFPLQFQAGLADQIAPIMDIRQTVNQVQTNHHPSCVELIEYPGLGHQVVAEMFDRAADWLAKHVY